MSLVCRPVGRGNWNPMVIAPPAWLYSVKVGDTFSLGGCLWRIAEIRT
jgi:hypothetical protein